MSNILTWGCKVKPRGVPKIWPISETVEPTSLISHLHIKLGHIVTPKQGKFEKPEQEPKEEERVGEQKDQDSDN